MFFRNNYFLDQHSFKNVPFRYFFLHLLIISEVCYFGFNQLIVWENIFLSCHCPKSKEEKMLYLTLFKTAADILK